MEDHGRHEDLSIELDMVAVIITDPSDRTDGVFG